MLFVNVRCTADELFKTIWSAYGDFKLSHHKVRGDKDYLESAWVSSIADLPSPQFQWDSPLGSDGNAKTAHLQASGKYRKVRYSTPPSGMATKAFHNEEVQFCSEYVPGQRYLVEAVVWTTAMYGDKFNPVIRYLITQHGKSMSRLQIKFAVDVKSSVSWVIKQAILKGVDGGIRGNFQIYRKILQTFHEVADAVEGESAEPETPTVPATPPVAVEEVAPASPAATPRRANAPLGLFAWADHLVYQDLVARLLGMASATDSALLAKGVAVMMTLMVVHMVVGVVTRLQRVCQMSTSSFIKGMCWPLENVLDFPDSTAEVLTGLVIVAACNQLLIAGSTFLDSYLRSLPPPAPSSRSASHPASPLRAIPTLPPAPTTDPVPVPPSPPEAAAAPLVLRRTFTAQGMFGWMGIGGGAKKSQDGAEPNISGSEGSEASAVATAARVSAASPPSTSDASRSTSAGGIARAPAAGSAAKAGARSLKAAAGKAGAGGAAGVGTAAAAAVPIAVPAPAASSASAGYSGGVKPETELSSDIGLLSSPPSTSSLSASARTGGPHGAKSAPQLTLNTAADMVVGEGIVLPLRLGSGSGDTPTGSQAGALMEGEEQDVAWVKGAATTAVAAVNTWGKSLLNAEALDSGAENFKQYMFGAWQKTQEGAKTFTASLAGQRDSSDGGDGGGGGGGSGASRRGHRQVPSFSAVMDSPMHIIEDYAGDDDAARQTRRRLSAASGGGAGASKDGRDPVELELSPTAEGAVEGAEAGPDGSVAGELEEPDNEGDEVEEEVFENERFQPFRNWGHTWPGHFLPSDRTGHWSDVGGRPGGADSMEFDKVAPALKKGWAWMEGEWQVDMAGLESDAVDADGWAYAFDFSLLRHPPPALAGKPTRSSFVRRRRWCRTRIRTGASTSSRRTAASSLSMDEHAPRPAAAISTGAGSRASTSVSPGASPSLSSDASAMATDTAGTSPLPGSPPSFSGVVSDGGSSCSGRTRAHSVAGSARSTGRSTQPLKETENTDAGWASRSVDSGLQGRRSGVLAPRGEGETQSVGSAEGGRSSRRPDRAAQADDAGGSALAVGVAAVRVAAHAGVSNAKGPEAALPGASEARGAGSDVRDGGTKDSSRDSGIRGGQWTSSAPSSSGGSVNSPDQPPQADGLKQEAVSSATVLDPLQAVVLADALVLDENGRTSRAPGKASTAESSLPASAVQTLARVGDGFGGGNTAPPTRSAAAPAAALSSTAADAAQQFVGSRSPAGSVCETGNGSSEGGKGETATLSSSAAAAAAPMSVTGSDNVGSKDVAGDGWSGSIGQAGFLEQVHIDGPAADDYEAWGDSREGTGHEGEGWSDLDADEEALVHMLGTS